MCDIQSLDYFRVYKQVRLVQTKDRVSNLVQRRRRKPPPRLSRDYSSGSDVEGSANANAFEKWVQERAHRTHTTAWSQVGQGLSSAANKGSFMGQRLR